VRGDRCTEDLLNVLTALVTVGGVAVSAAAFGPSDRANSLAVLCASAGVILAAIALVMVELWLTARNLVQRARPSAQRFEAHRYAVQLHRQQVLNATAFQFGYALAEGRPAERAWDEALERCHTGPVPDQPLVEMAA
jgi:hypothetical protein